MKRQRFRGDQAFTLIEVIMAVVLTGTIIGVLAAAVMVTLGPDERSSDQLVSSHDAQVASIWVPSDLESAGPVDPVVDLAADTALPCTGTAPGTNVLRLQWVQPDPVATGYAVSYRIVADGVQWSLVRASCTDGGAIEEHIIARSLEGPAAAGAVVEGRRVTLAFTTHLGEDVEVSATRRTPDGGPTTTAPSTTTTSTLPPTTTSTSTTSTTSTSTTSTTSTTLPPTTTTTVAPTTTTTSSSSCRVTSVTASPDSIGRRSDGHLTGNVAIEVRTVGTGTCGTLVLRYQTWRFLWDFTATTPLTLQGGGRWTGTIPGASAAGAQFFTPGDKELMVVRSDGTELPPAGTLEVR